MEDIYSGLIYQHSLANILNVSQSFIKLLHQSKKHADVLVVFLTDIIGTKKSMIILMLFFVD